MIDSEVFINHLLDQVSLLREQIKFKDQHINSLLEHSSRRDDISFIKRFTVTRKCKTKKYSTKIRSGTNFIYNTNANNKKNLNNSDVIYVDNNETLAISNCITLKEKDYHVASVPEKELPKNTQSHNSSNKKEIIVLTRSLLITQNQSSC